MTTCSDCHRPAVKPVGTRNYCDEHLLALYATFTSPALAHVGYGITDGAYVRCTSCNATWQGVTGDRCWWCQRSYAVMLEHQADLVTQPPDLDPDMADAVINARMAAWADRLWRAVLAGIIDERQAQRALTQQMKKAA